MSSTTLRGIVVPTAWSSGGQVLRVAILTADEKQYDVVDSGLGRRLLHELREEIEARVHIDHTVSDRLRATILSYETVKEDDDEAVPDSLADKPDQGQW